MLSQIKSIRKTHLIYCAIAVFYFWMAAQIPYTHDDWDWGLDIGLHQWLHATVNSRYAGNFFEVIMTRSELLKTIIMGSGYFLIPFCLSHFAMKLIPSASKNTKLTLFLLANCLLLTINRDIWRQAYGWVAGYANFAISALFMIPWINLLLSVFDDHPRVKHQAVPQLLFLFLLCICSQLFIENLAFYHILLALTLCIIHYLRNRRIPIDNLIALFGAAIGLVIMFSSSLYDTLFSVGQAVDNYRQIPLLSSGSLGNAIRQLLITCLHLGVRLYTENHILTLFILCIMSMNLFTASNVDAGKARLLFAANTLLSILVVCSCIYDHMAQYHLTIMYIYDFAISIAYFCVVLLESVLLFRNQSAKLIKLLLLWLSAPLVIAPLIVTTETGSRLFFTSNIFVILFALILTGEYLTHYHLQTNRLVFRASALLTIMLFLFHGYIYAQIGSCKRERDAIIEETRNTACTEIILPEYPFSEYLHFPNATEEKRVQFFKEFYEIDPAVQVIFK